MWRKLKIGLFEFRSINYYNNNNARKARKEAQVQNTKSKNHQYVRKKKIIYEQSEQE